MIKYKTIIQELKNCVILDKTLTFLLYLDYTQVNTVIDTDVGIGLVFTLFGLPSFVLFNKNTVSILNRGFLRSAVNNRNWRAVPKKVNKSKIFDDVTLRLKNGQNTHLLTHWDVFYKINSVSKRPNYS